MISNDILKRLREALRLDDAAMLEIFALGGSKNDTAMLAAMLKSDEEPGFTICDAQTLSLFLDGLIVLKRGRRDDAPVPAPITDSVISNNMILKKLRIAFAMRDEDVLEALKLAGIAVTKSELTALFRRPGQPNYQRCGDQFLRNFLLGIKLRHQAQ